MDISAALVRRRRRAGHRADQAFQAAVTLDPKSADAWDRLGIVWAAQGKQRLPEAIFAFDRAVRLNPEGVEARQHLELARRQLAEDNSGKSLPK